MPGIVIRDKKIVYWPIPKAACTSVKQRVAEMQALSVAGSVHAAPFEWTADPIEGFRNVAIVREPFGRIRSLWAEKVSGPEAPGVMQGKLDPAVFGNFLEKFWVGMRFDDFVRAVVSIPLSQADPHWAPQTTQIPPNTTIYRMEDTMDLLKMLLPERNIGPRIDPKPTHVLPVLAQIRAYYLQDYLHLGYQSHRLFIDCDGVLTDGRLHVGLTGEKMFKSFHTRDVRALRELVARGFEVTLVTADDWEGLHLFAAKVGVDVMVSRDKEMGNDCNYIAVGDDAWDVPMLSGAFMSFCPQNADTSVRSLPDIRVLPVNGGEGVVAELLRALVL